MRLFIGVWLEQAMTDEVLRFINLARNESTGLKWTAPENLHFTLKFLGEVPPGQVEPLRQSLEEIIRKHRPFAIELGQIGFFPNRRTSRVVWIGVTRGAIELGELAASIEKSCAAVGFESSQQLFRPHLTIARAKRDTIPTIGLEDAGGFKSVSWINSFSLIESRLQTGGSVYRSIADFGLGKGSD